MGREDGDLLAGLGAAIAVNPSSHVRLRSGIAPVGQFVKSGLDFGIAIDSFSFDDDDDAFRELRVTHWLHSISYAEHPLTPARLFGAALKTGFRIANNVDGYGGTGPGAPAVFVLPDYDAMAYDAMAAWSTSSTSCSPAHPIALSNGSTWLGAKSFATARFSVSTSTPSRLDFARAGRTRAYMDAMRPVLRRSQATLESFFKSGGHRGGE